MSGLKKETILNYHPLDFENVSLTQEEILTWFDLLDAFWIHDGDPKKPHAQLTSGKCSNGFFDCSRVLCYPNLCEILARQLARKLLKTGKIENVDWVIGSSYSAITFSYEVAKALGAIHCFTEKDPDDPKGKKMVWRRMKIPRGKNVLQIEELITTSGTFREVRRAVEEGNPEQVNFLPIVGTLVHRPPKLPTDYGEISVVALVEKEIWAVDQSECPLCKAGSPRLRPKTHWRQLTGKT